MSGTAHSGGVLPGCDFAIVTIIDEARQSICEQLGLSAEIHLGGCTYWWGRLAARDGDGEHVVVCGQTLHQSTIPATSFTSRMLRTLKPRCLLIADIAGGVKARGGLALGDVVVGGELNFYEYAKATEQGDEPRSFSVAPPSPRLTDIARAIGTRPGGAWRAGLERDRPESTEAKIHLGEIAVGNKLLGNPHDPRLADLLERYPKVLAVDMESTGVAYSVYEAVSEGIHSELLVLRGISDFIDDTDNQGVRDRWRIPACNAAAAAARALITSTPASSDTINGALAGRRSRGRSAILGTWLLLLVAAGPFGYQLAHASPPSVTTVRSSVIQLGFARPWRAAGPAGRAIAGLHLRSPIALELPDRTLLLAGLVANAAMGPDPAPAALRARWDGPVVARSITDPTGLLYRARVRGGYDRLTMLSTSAGWIAIACEGDREVALTSCEEIMARAKPLNAEPRPVGPSAGTAAALNALMEKVSLAQLAAKRGLSSRLTAQRAAAASKVATVLGNAGSSVGRLDTGPRDTTGLHEARKALEAGAGALWDLAAAALPPQAGRYLRAVRRVKGAEADLASALKRAGYPVGNAGPPAGT
jgi:nucleoside phosphorylase